jgi:hypothetical protein
VQSLRHGFGSRLRNVGVGFGEDITRFVSFKCGNSPVCTENLIRFDLMAESLNVGRADRADILPLEPGRLVLQAKEPT